MSVDHQYMFEDSTEEETRLREQSAVLDPLTEEFLVRAGIGPGMRVLDLGTGSGAVAAIAARLVGETGYVLGVDRDAESLDTARSALADVPQVEFAEAVLPDLDLPGSGPAGDFDAVIGRLVLAHVPDPVAVLTSAARQLRRGGLLCVQEADMTCRWTSEETPLWTQLRSWLLEAFERLGVHARMGPQLFAAYRGAGLPDPTMMMGAPVGGGATSPAFGWSNALAAIVELVERLGIATAEEIGADTLTDRLNAEIDARDGMVVGPGLFGAWCRLPAH